MSDNMGLETLVKLPQELRDHIYGYLMHWYNYGEIDEAPKWRYSKRPWSLRAQYHSLAICRASRRVYFEVTSLLYDQWHLTFQVCPKHFTDHLRSPMGHIPKIEVRVSHARLGTYYLPLLTGPNTSRQPCRLFRGVPYHRFASVTVEMLPHDQSNPGELVISWRASKTIAWVLQSHPPSALKFAALGDWSTNSNISFINSGGRVNLSALRMLVTPFEYLANPYATKVSLLYPLPRDSRHFDQSSTFVPSTKFIVVGPDCDLGFTESRAELRQRIRYHKYADLWFKKELDEMQGKTAAHLRLQRWVFWDLSYECRIIGLINQLNHHMRLDLFAEFAERWAVMRAMHYDLRHDDLVTWSGKIYDEDPLEKSRLFYETRHQRRLGWRAPLKAHGNPRKDDWNWRKLRYQGLFYYRRILITSNGVLWDPSHTTKSEREPHISHLNKVLYVHEPSGKPSNRPQWTPLDSRFLASNDIISEDSQEDL